MAIRKANLEERKQNKAEKLAKWKAIQKNRATAKAIKDKLKEVKVKMEQKMSDEVEFIGSHLSKRFSTVESKSILRRVMRTWAGKKVPNL